MRFEVLAMGKEKFTVRWFVTPCCFVDGGSRFLSSKLHGVTSQTKATFQFKKVGKFVA
jgi:hypothetical protein